jgi:hypothetical protein
MDETEAVARALAPEAFGRPFDECRFYAKEACRMFARTAIEALDAHRLREEHSEAEAFRLSVEACDGDSVEEKYRSYMRLQVEAGLAPEQGAET